MGSANGTPRVNEFGHTYDEVEKPIESYLPAWYEAYVVSGERDTHAVFMKLTGLTRHEAKVLCYKIAYSVYNSDIIKAYNEIGEVICSDL